MSRKFNVAIIGATGVVGGETIKILEEVNFPVNKLVAIASNSSIGKKVSFNNKEIPVDSLEYLNCEDMDIIFSSSSSEVSKLLFEKVNGKKEKKCVIIDKTAFFRMQDDVPLIVPEINAKEIVKFKNQRVIANPNCCAIPLSIILAALNHLNIKRVNIATYQSVSGAGKNAMEDLYKQTKQKYIFTEELEEEKSVPSFAFNVIPQIGQINPENGYSDEENKIMAEIKKILNKDIKLNVTSVRVPVFVGHCFALDIEYSNNSSVKQVKELFSQNPNIKLMENPFTPKEITEDLIYVARVRQNYGQENHLSLWAGVDNLRKGAALNSVQIAQHLIKHYL